MNNRPKCEGIAFLCGSPGPRTSNDVKGKSVVYETGTAITADEDVRLCGMVSESQESTK
jgi:hypothetical protein